jgi:hypothetical protein
VFADWMAAHARAVDHALAADDPWIGFRSYVEAATAMQVRDHGIADLVTMDVSMAPKIEKPRAGVRGVG